MPLQCLGMTPCTRNAAWSVAIVEDQTIVRELMSDFLAQVPGIEVVIKAERADEFWKMMAGHRVDLVVLDILLPDGSGVDVLLRLKKMMRKPRVLMVTAVDRPLPLQAALDGGADGIVSKGAPLQHLRLAVQTVMAGGRYIDPAAAAILQTANSETGQPLTAREQQVATYIARGLTTKAIAETLCISTKTITNHRTAFMKKIGARNTADVTRYVTEQNWI